MIEIVRQSGLEDKQKRTKDWALETSEVENDNLLEVTEPVAGLYEACKKLLRQLCLHRTKKLKPEIPSIHMRNELTRLHLWGAELDMTVVDEALGSSNRLKEVILQRLIDIAQLLLRGRSKLP